MSNTMYILFLKIFLESDTDFKLLFESCFKFKFWVQDSLAQAYYMYVGSTLIVLYFYFKSLFKWKIIPSFLYYLKKYKCKQYFSTSLSCIGQSFFFILISINNYKRYLLLVHPLIYSLSQLNWTGVHMYRYELEVGIYCTWKLPSLS